MKWTSSMDRSSMFLLSCSSHFPKWNSKALLTLPWSEKLDWPTPKPCIVISLFKLMPPAMTLHQSALLPLKTVPDMGGWHYFSCLNVHDIYLIQRLITKSVISNVVRFFFYMFAELYWLLVEYSSASLHAPQETFAGVIARDLLNPVNSTMGYCFRL